MNNLGTFILTIVETILAMTSFAGAARYYQEKKHYLFSCQLVCGIVLIAYVISRAV